MSHRVSCHLLQFLLAQNSTGDGFAGTRLLCKFRGARVCASMCTRIAVLRLTCSAELPEKLPMKHGFILSWAMWILRPCSCDVVTSLQLGMEMKFEVFMAVRVYILFSGFIWRVIWKVVASSRSTYSFYLEGRNWSLQFSRSCPTYYDVISGIWLVFSLKLRLWCTSRYRLLLVTVFWQELSSVTALLMPSFIDQSIPASQFLAIEHQMIDSWLMILNGRVRKESWPNLRHYPGLLLWGLRKITKSFSVDIWPARRDLIFRPPDF
jgi:hypothetical protein